MKSIAQRLYRGVRIWRWKWRFVQAMLRIVARERNAAVIRFCEGCAEDAWNWNFALNRGDLDKALATDPGHVVTRMTKGTLSSFYIPPL